MTTAAVMEWISVKDRLPEPGYFQDYLVWIPNQSKRGGYRDTASYGDYICENDDIRPDDPLYVESDDGNMKGSGWHREEETHGGEYDTVFIDLNSKVTHWMPLPEPPK